MTMKELVARNRSYRRFYQEVPKAWDKDASPKS